ncbi:MAG: hypothetical protein J0I41_15650 [Filimonas sp.]|nr:hypothetical protein [Filimonas sp.]
MSSNLYKELVFNDYLQKREINVLSLNLTQPTPAKLKDECLRVCNSRYDEKDVKILEYFLKYSHIKDKDDCLKKIKKCEIARFRPLLHFLNGKINKPDIGTIDLLAWLINFKPRPYEVGRDYNEEGVVEVKEVVDGKVKENSLLSELEKVTEFFNIEKTEPEKIDDRKEESEEEKRSIFKQVSSNESIDGDAPNGMSKKGYKKQRYVIISIAFLIIACVLGYALRKPDGQKIATQIGSPPTLLPQRCMYWASEEYKEIDCTKKYGSDTILVAFDSVKIITFKKITRPDTITLESKGVICYTKVNRGKDIVFFTSDGFHPITHSRLKPMTVYIYNKYILPLKQKI